MADVAHVLWAANQGCLGFHPWPYRAARPGATSTSCASTSIRRPASTFEMVREAAAEVRTFLGEQGITAFPKTTGNRGLHLYVRVEPGWDSFGVRQAAVSVARAMEARRPGADHRRRGGRRSAGRGCSSTSTRTPRTRRCSAPGACGPASAPRCRRRSAGTSCRRSTPTTSRWPPCRRASPPTAIRGQRIDDAPHSIEPLVERYRGRPRRRHPRRAVAARVPEDARRGPPREPQPGPPRLTDPPSGGRALLESGAVDLSPSRDAVDEPVADERDATSACDCASARWCGRAGPWPSVRSC